MATDYWLVLQSNPSYCTVMLAGLILIPYPESPQLVHCLGNVEAISKMVG